MKRPIETPELERVLQAARSLGEDARVPYAFEKRVMHALRSSRPLDAWSVWTQSLWRAAAACVGITLLTGAFANFDEETPVQPELMAADFEQAVLAPLTPNETW